MQTDCKDYLLQYSFEIIRVQLAFSGDFLGEIYKNSTILQIFSESFLYDNGVFHVFHVNRSVNIFLLHRKIFYSVKQIC